MSFTTHQLQFLQRLVSERPEQRRAGGVALLLCEHYSLGTAIGSQVVYRAEHLQRAEQLLRAHDLPVEAHVSGASRADMATFGGLSEKSLSVAPHAGSIAVKCVGTCLHDGNALWTPAGSYLVVTPDVGARITCDRLLLVENLETFRQLERYDWIDYHGLAVLAVFRGDSLLSTGDAAALVRQRTERVWAFVDFDPAGLHIASLLPNDRLERIVIPDLAWLQQASKTSRGRQLFADQEPRLRHALDSAEHPEVRALWKELLALRGGVTQERMLSLRGETPKC